MSFTRNHFTEPRSHPFVNMFPRNEEFDEEDEGLFRVNSILHHKKITLFGGKISIIAPMGNLMDCNLAITTIQTRVSNVKIRIKAKQEPRKGHESLWVGVRVRETTAVGMIQKKGKIAREQLEINKT